MKREQMKQQKITRLTQTKGDDNKKIDENSKRSQTKFKVNDQKTTDENHYIQTSNMNKY